MEVRCALSARTLRYYRDNSTLESTRVYLDRPFLFPDCDDIGYYRDNITLESTRVYLDGPFLFLNAMILDIIAIKPSKLHIDKSPTLAEHLTRYIFSNISDSRMIRMTKSN